MFCATSQRLFHRCRGGCTYIDTPKFLNGIKSDNLLEKIVPVVALSHALVDRGHTTLPGSGALYLAAWGLGEPQSPLVLKRMLHVEVILVVKDSDRCIVILGLASLLLPSGVDGDRRQVDLLVHVGRLNSCVRHRVGSRVVLSLCIWRWREMNGRDSKFKSSRVCCPAERR